MKELEPLTFRENIELSIKKQQETSYRLKGKITLRHGNRLFEINRITEEVKPATYKLGKVQLSGEKEPDQLITSPDCIYIPAISKSAALRRYQKNPSQDAYYDQRPKFTFVDTHWGVVAEPLKKGGF